MDNTFDLYLELPKLSSRLHRSSVNLRVRRESASLSALNASFFIMPPIGGNEILVSANRLRRVLRVSPVNTTPQRECRARSIGAPAPRLLRVYRQTDYTVAGVTVRVGRRVPDTVFAAVDARVAVLVTAWNPMCIDECRVAGTIACSGACASGCGGLWYWTRRDRCIAGTKRCCLWPEMLGWSSNSPRDSASAQWSSYDEVSRRSCGCCHFPHHALPLGERSTDCAEYGDRSV